MLSRIAPRILSRVAARSVQSTLVASAPVLSARAARFSTAAAPKTDAPAMFCFQCEQTRDSTGCKTVGVCGKTPEVAALQDVIMHVIRGISTLAYAAFKVGGDKFQDTAIDHYVRDASFSTMTNVNFDDARMMEYIQQGINLRNQAKNLYINACKSKNVTPDNAVLNSPFVTYVPKSFDLAHKDAVVAEAKELGLFRRKEKDGDDVVGLQELTCYGLKGTAAYAHHAATLGKDSPAVYQELHRLYAIIANPKSTVPELLGAAMDCGKLNLTVMSMLDDGHTTAYGHPEPHTVNCTPVPGKAILVSGHDLVDLEEILKQTAGKNINVYTHGEMLPAHAYPKFKQYKHLAGHYGGPWQLQKFEFAQFPGSIILTSNCIIEPAKSYKKRIFTMNTVGFPGLTHIKNKDFSPLIKAAEEAEGFNAGNIKTASKDPLLVGFARNTIMSVADKVIGAIQGGALKRIVFIGGCDGTEGERSYFTQLATGLPKDTVILTAGCGKYRLNRAIKGDIGGIPRLLDMGQCNDSYSGIAVAVALANALKTDVNSLPLSFGVSWLEQKAVAVLLTLLHLNIKNIHLGPTLPAFATPTMLNILVEKFGIRPVNAADPQADIKLMMAGKY